MEYDYTVEKPKTTSRRYLRNQIKSKLRLKRKLGFAKNEVVYDNQLKKESK